MRVKVKRIGNHSLPLPKYETEGAAGFDLRAVLYYSELVSAGYSGGDCGSIDGYDWAEVNPGKSIALSVGFAFEVQEGFELQVRGRSGLAFKHEIVACHSPGTVDADYRGEVRVKLWNLGTEPFEIGHGDRIAQGVIAPVVRAELVESEELSETARGGNGFGSTGAA